MDTLSEKLFLASVGNFEDLWVCDLITEPVAGGPGSCD